MGATIAKHEMYDPRKIDSIYQSLLSARQEGKDQKYEIAIDGFPVIAKTSDPEKFMGYSEYLSQDSKTVIIYFFKGNGQTDKYFFHIQPDTYQKAVELKGLENGNSKTLDEAELTEKIRKDLHYEDLLKENAALKKEVEEHERIHVQMEKEIENIKSNRDLGLQGIGALLLNGALNSEAVKKNFPIVGELAGMNNPKTTPTPTENEASFKRQTRATDNVEDATEVEENEQGEETYKVTGREKRYILFIDDIRNRIGEIELANVMHLLDLVACNPAAIPYAIRHVTNFLKMKEQHQNQETKNL